MLSQFDVIKLILLNECKTKENFEKTRHVKNNDRSKKPVLKKHRNKIWYDRILLDQQNLNLYNLNLKSIL